MATVKKVKAPVDNNIRLVRTQVAHNAASYHTSLQVPKPAVLSRVSQQAAPRGGAYQPKNRNSATESTENTERFKDLSLHAAPTKWVNMKNYIHS
jgi:hypothetical protein